MIILNLGIEKKLGNKPIVTYKHLVKNMNNLFNIRHMMQDDITKVYEVERRCFPFPFGETLIGNIYFGAPELCFILEQEDRVVGFLLAGYTSIPKQAHILSVAILEEFRGRGLGKKIMEHFVKKVDSLNYTSVKLEVAVDNEIAIKLYEELGFEIITKIRKYYQDDSDAFLMIKNHI